VCMTSPTWNLRRQWCLHLCRMRPTTIQHTVCHLLHTYSAQVAESIPFLLSQVTLVPPRQRLTSLTMAEGKPVRPYSLSGSRFLSKLPGCCVRQVGWAPSREMGARRSTLRLQQPSSPQGHPTTSFAFSSIRFGLFRDTYLP
jgi:hypothetical protein